MRKISTRLFDCHFYTVELRKYIILLDKFFFTFMESNVKMELKTQISIFFFC